MRLKQIQFIDNKYIYLVIVNLNHSQFISTITEIWPVSFMYGKYASDQVSPMFWNAQILNKIVSL